MLDVIAFFFNEQLCTFLAEYIDAKSSVLIRILY